MGSPAARRVCLICFTHLDPNASPRRIGKKQRHIIAAAATAATAATAAAAATTATTSTAAAAGHRATVTCGREFHAGCRRDLEAKFGLRYICPDP